MEPKFTTLDKHTEIKLLNLIKHKHQKCAVMLMLDCGLRVTECVTLKIENFDFKRKTLTVNSLKKRGDIVTRTIPISERAYQALAEHITSLESTAADSYIFLNKRTGTHLSRKSMNRMFDRLALKDPALLKIHPHALRHTCATKLLATGAQLHEIKDILGHKSYDTTLIYSHIPTQTLRDRIATASETHKTKFERLTHYFFPKKPAQLINIRSSANIIIGRTTEITKALNLIEKKVNTIFLGGTGVGKTHILNQVIADNKKVLQMDDFSNLKKTLANALLVLYKGDKEHVFNLIYPEFTDEKLIQHLQKDSIQNLCKELISATQKHEYILAIDNCDQITPKGIQMLESLKDHFVIITSARSVSTNKSSFLWNFEIIRLDNLSRTHSLELIHKLSHDLDIEDFELYRNHIFEQSSGNPRVIHELIDRYNKEPLITSDVVRNIRHTASLREFDFSIVVLLGLGSLAVLRYLSAETGNDSLRFIGGSAMVLMIISRYFFSFGKKKLI